MQLLALRKIRKDENNFCVISWILERKRPFTKFAFTHVKSSKLNIPGLLAHITLTSGATACFLFDFLSFSGEFANNLGISLDDCCCNNKDLSCKTKKNICRDQYNDLIDYSVQILISFESLQTIWYITQRVLPLNFQNQRKNSKNIETYRAIIKISILFLLWITCCWSSSALGRLVLGLPRFL